MYDGRLKFTIKKLGKCINISKMEPGKLNNERGLKYTVNSNAFRLNFFALFEICWVYMSDNLTFFKFT